MQAIGLVETRGLLAAIECADVMLKAAQVELVERVFVGGGLVTVTVTGDVGAVKAAVEAGASSVERLSALFLVSQHVIPRPHSDIGLIIGSDSPGEPAAVDPDPARVTESEAEDVADTAVIISAELTEIPVQASDGAEDDAVREEEKPQTEAHAEASEEAGERDNAPDQAISGTLKKGRVDEMVRNSGIEKAVEVLGMVTASKLRSLAKEYEGFGLTGAALSKAGKEKLLQKFRKYYEMPL